MKLVNFYRKPISVFVMVTFTILLCLWANQSPAAPAAPAAEKSSATALEKSQGESSSFIEKEESEHAYKKGHKFPWLIVAVVAVVGGAALYFLVLKKKNYTLTVTVGEGVTGTPAAGTSTDKKGTAIAYNYTLQSGYDNLSVTLDGAAVAASGTVTMNANHTLAVSATKTYVLTVSRGEHVDGMPASGTQNYASGTNVSYGYTPASGYANLEVKIDNIAAATTGTITMNANHTLTANLLGANIEVNSTPAGAKIYLDNVDSGFTTPHSFFFATAVTKAVLLRYSCGYKEITQTVSASVGQTQTINANLVAGINEEFTIPASPCWLPYYSANWSTSGGNYIYNGAATPWSPNLYNSSFSGDYTVSMKIKQTLGTADRARGFFLGTSTSMTNASGYLFYIGASGSGTLYRIYRLTNYNLITNLGTWDLIQDGLAGAINTGLNKWNIIKIGKAGSQYLFYINNIPYYTFNDATFNPTYCMLILGCGGTATEMLIDYVNLSSGSSAGSLPSLPMKIMPAAYKENLPSKLAPGER